MQPAIEPGLRKELGVGSRFDHPTAIEDDDPVGTAHSRQAMRNDQHLSLIHI